MAKAEGKKNDGANGVPTSETKILMCQCGSTAFDIKKRTKTSISLVCGKCGLRCSVKGSIATVRVRQQEIEYAMQNTVIEPEPEEDSGGGAAPGEKTGDGTGPTGPEYVTLRFRIMKGDQKDVIDRAMEACRVANCGDDKYREQTWQGHALEYICADYLSGASHDVLQIVDAMDAAVEDAERIAEEDGKKAPTPRRVRDLRGKVRDKLARESGILPADFFGEDEDRQLELPEGEDAESEDGAEPEQYECPECGAKFDDAAEQCPKCGVSFEFGEDEEEGEGGEEEVGADERQEEEGDEEEFEPVPDGGRLMKAVVSTLEGYLEEAQSAGVGEQELPEHIVRDGSVPAEDLVKKWTAEGGYLVRILGDKRTIDGNEERPAVCAWVAAEPKDLALDFSIEYDDATDDILGDGATEIVELLPPDYDEIEPWAQPHFADRREQI